MPYVIAGHVILVALAGYGLARLVYQRYLRPKLYHVAHEDFQTTIKYKHVQVGGIALAIAGLLGVVVGALVWLMTSNPGTSQQWIFIWLGVILIAALFVAEGIMTETQIDIHDNHLSYQQRFGFTRDTRSDSLNAGLIRVYYGRGFTRLGPRFTLFVDTLDTSQIVLLRHLYDEQVAVLIKDEIVSRFDLSGLSEQGVGHSLQENWRGTY